MRTVKNRCGWRNDMFVLTSTSSFNGQRNWTNNKRRKRMDRTESCKKINSNLLRELEKNEDRNIYATSRKKNERRWSSEGSSCSRVNTFADFAESMN
jgi:hypothetical protein